MLILNQKEVESIIPLGEIKKVIDVVEKAFFDYGKEKVQMPAKLYLYFKEFNGDLRIMPSYSETLKIAGTKIVNVHPDNPKRRLKSVMAVIVLNDPRTGFPLALMDGTYITALRTGAASAVATKYLARKEAKTLGVVGAGFQAITQVAAISRVKRLKEILVYDINEKAIENLGKILAKEKIKIRKGELKKVCQKDILVTTTPVRAPIVKKEWISPGTHINAIGADACYTFDTEIMTPDGFISVGKLNPGMEVWSVNPETKTLEKTKIVKMHRYKYKGKIIQAKTLYTSFNVTPNHNIPNFSRDGKRFLGFIKASELKNRWQTVTTIKTYWRGEDKKEFTLPKIKRTNNAQKEYTFKMEDWMSFLGWYISEGFLHSSNYSIGISQEDKRKKEEIRKVLTKMGFRVFEDGAGLFFGSKQVFEYLKLNAGNDATKKRIPKEFLNLDKKYLQYLFDSLINGDGWSRKTKTGKERYGFSTTSRILVDQFIELSIKLGKFCTLYFNGEGRLLEGKIGERIIHPLHPVYQVGVGARDGYFTRSVFKKNIKEIKKNCWVACPQLEKNHIPVIRHEGKITMNGNSGKEELDPQILKSAKIVVDNWEQASHSGEINVPLAKGIISKKDIFGGLGEIVVGKKPGRENEREITLFDSTGLAIQDLYTANLVYNLAKRKKIGREIEIF